MRTRAAVLHAAPGTWSVEEIELDAPGPTEALVRMVAVGLCHSDDHFATGDSGSPKPYLGGHEGAGVVEAIGAEVRGLAVGDHVLTSFIAACGTCVWCARGMGNLCDWGAHVITGDQPSGGYRAHTLDGQDIATFGALGAFAERQVYDERSLIRIEPDLPLDRACLVACAVQTGVGSATTAGGVRPGDVVIVVGAGGVGMNAVQGASLAGAREVVVVDPNPARVEQAPVFGATRVFAAFEPALGFVMSTTNGQGADVTILTPSLVTNEIIGQGLVSIRKGGTLVVTGASREDEAGVVPSLNAIHVAMSQKRIQGALYGGQAPRDAIPGLLGLYRAGRLKLDDLVTARYRLDDINSAYEDLRAGRNIRGIIDFTL